MRPTLPLAADSMIVRRLRVGRIIVIPFRSWPSLAAQDDGAAARA
jgi:hypothetical protein